MPLLAIEGVSKRFGGIRALDDVGLSLEAGEAVGLIGPNGAGKTTLFDCVTGVVRPDRGRIYLDGRRIEQLPIYRRSRLGIGRTFQRIELFANMSARDHFLVALRQHEGDGSLFKDLLWKGAASAGETAQADRLIHELGLAEVADRSIETLSLGQGRLVELGRALIQSPKLLLLDEPSSGLDSREAEALGVLVNEVRQETATAVLIVEHDLELVHAVAARAVVLDFGRVIAEGPLDDVLAEPSVREAYLGEGAGA
jgi:branched-chain amino acid transport system ATP-binding protein